MTIKIKWHVPLLLSILLALANIVCAQQNLQDDFEGNGTITNWSGDDCGINTRLPNPHQIGVNTSDTVMEYNDIGGTYANTRFQLTENFELSNHYTFSFKIYVPSSGLTGNQTNKVSLKLQDGSLGAPWATQCEIIKTIIIDQWQTISFDFKNDNFFNLNASSPIPTQRTDFNRVLIQINGENNNDHVLAYLDDFYYDGTITNNNGPVYDQLIWSDEFNIDGPLNSNNWFHQTQLPPGGNWYNNEIQHYTNRLDNSVVDNGVLKIFAKKEVFTDQNVTKQYTSARLNSKFAFQYGKIEVRAKLPTGAGTWPAIWMLGKNINEDGAYWDNQGFGTTSWPACGELDIMEHWGNNQNYVQSATHTPSSSGATVNHGGQSVATATTAFHLYSLEWSSEKLIFSVDGLPHFTYNPPTKDASTWPFDAEAYILFNIAIQPSIDPNFIESAMEIDYIRIYQASPLSIKKISNSSQIIHRYPNPINDQLTIELDNANDQEINLTIYSVEGKQLKNYKTVIENNKLTLTGLEDLSNGMYLFSFQVDNENHSMKIFKN